MTDMTIIEEFEVRPGALSPPLRVFFDRDTALDFRDRERPDCTVFGRAVNAADCTATPWAEVIR